MPGDAPAFNQLNVVVRDMAATIAFYRRLGLTIDAAPGTDHVAVDLPSGLLLEFDTVEFARQWDSGFRDSTGGSAVLGFALPSREAVDALYADLTESGHRARQRPYDAFWGARYALVEDPDGTAVGLMSPIEEARRFWPPQPAPSGV